MVALLRPQCDVSVALSSSLGIIVTANMSERKNFAQLYQVAVQTQQCFDSVSSSCHRLAQVF